MAYNVAANLRPVRPGAAFLDSRDAAQRNALMRGQDERAAQAQDFSQQNTQFNQNRLTAQDQVETGEREKAIDLEETKQLYSHLSNLAAAPPEQFSALAAQVAADPIVQKHGITIEDFSDQREAAMAAKILGGRLGQVAPDQFEQVNGPRGSVIKKNTRTGDLSQVVGPDNTETVPRSAPAGYTFNSDGRTLSPIPGGPADPNTTTTKDNSRTFAKADKLRDEFNTQSKDFITVGDSYNVVREVAKDPSAAGDLSLIFAYMKMLDPNSVVREQEFANAQNAAGVPDRIRNTFNKILNGERLNPVQRKDFIEQAKNLFNTKKARQDTITKRYTEIAKRNNVDPDDVVGDLSVLMPTSSPAAPSATGLPAADPGVPTATGPNGEKLILFQGQWKPYDPTGSSVPKNLIRAR